MDSMEVKDPWGVRVIFNHPDKGAEVYADENRAAHLIGSHNPGEAKHVRCTLVKRKIDWLGAVPDTIAKAQLRLLASKNGQTFHARRYNEGIHLVIVEDGQVKGAYGLVSQYPQHNDPSNPSDRTEPFSDEIKDAIVEHVRH